MVAAGLANSRTVPACVGFRACDRASVRLETLLAGEVRHELAIPPT